MNARDALEDAAANLLARARAAGLTIATAESCTGGLIAGTLTEIAGSSAVVDRGFVTYSNAAKTEMLGVDADLIESRGAVSREVALAMVEGVFAMSPVDLAVAVTGIAGPGGGSAEKPVGLVHLAAGRRGHDPVHIERRFGDIGRSAVRTATIAAALDLVAGLLPR